MTQERPSNLSFYQSQQTAEDYLTHAVTAGESRMCSVLRGQELVVEIGCGAGRLFDRLSNEVDSLVGVDYAAVPLRILAARRPDANLVLANATELPFEPDTFTAAVLGYHVIESILPQGLRAIALREAARVVCRGGDVLLSRHLRRSYHPLSQVTALVVGRVHEFGDLTGPSRVGGDEDSRLEFTMHVLSEREMAGLARGAGLSRVARWDFDSGKPVRSRTRSVIEHYTVTEG